MTTRKNVTDQTKAPAKRARKTAKRIPADELNPQQDLIGAPPPPQPTESDSGMSPDVSADEVDQRMDRDADQSESPAPSIQHPVSPPIPVHTGIAPEGGRLIPSGVSNPGRPQTSTAVQTWMFATNHLNFLYMLAAGMVMGPAGFFGKHYRDPSSDVPGLIPVFRDACPEEAIQQAVSEQAHLRPCIGEIDLAGIVGPTGIVSYEGVVSSGTLPSVVDSKTVALLVPAPLPISLVKRLIFRSPADRKEFEVAARNFANIDLACLNIEVAEQFFSSGHPIVWPVPVPQGSPLLVVDQPPARGDAIGGVLAVLYQVANRSELCCTCYRIASGANVPGDFEATQLDPVLAELGAWFEVGPRPDTSVQGRIYWGVVKALVDARRGGSTEAPVDIVLEFLDGQITDLQEAAHKSRLERLVSDMRSVFGLGGGTISQLFERHKGSLSRPLLLFCLRERSVDLLEFTHPDLRDEELILAAVLFGVRDGWIRMPVELRTPNGLARFVEHRMFEAEGCERGHRLSLDPVPNRPMPLRELVTGSEVSWNEVRSASLAQVASRLGWHDCLTSRMRFPPGQYRLNVSVEGIELVVRGGIGRPVVEIDRGALLKKISQWPPLPLDVEGEVRAALHFRGN